MKFFLFSTLSLLLFTSCHDLKKQNQLKKMDALILAVSEIAAELKEIDTSKMEMLILEITKTRTSIQENYLSDTLSVTLGQELEDYRQAGNQAIWVKHTLPVLLRTLAETESRLTQLRADISTGNGERDQYDAYIEKEQAQVDALKTVHQSLLKNSLEAIQTHQELNDKLLEFKNRILLKNNVL